MAFLLEANIPSKVLVQRKCNREHWTLCWTFLVSLTLFLIKDYKPEVPLAKLQVL